MRLGGWHRIGIVISVLWLIGVPIYAFEEDISRAKRLSAESIDFCVIHLERTNPNIDCAKEGTPYYENVHKDWAAETLFFLAAIPTMWMMTYIGRGLLYLVRGIVRWVIKGFRPVSNTIKY